MHELWHQCNANCRLKMFRIFGLSFRVFHHFEIWGKIPLNTSWLTEKNSWSSNSQPLTKWKLPCTSPPFNFKLLWMNLKRTGWHHRGGFFLHCFTKTRSIKDAKRTCQRHIQVSDTGSGEMLISTTWSNRANKQHVCHLCAFPLNPPRLAPHPRRHTPTAKQIAVLILTKHGGLALSFNIYIHRRRYRARFIPSQYGMDEE